MLKHTKRWEELISVVYFMSATRSEVSPFQSHSALRLPFLWAKSWGGRCVCHSQIAKPAPCPRAWWPRSWATWRVGRLPGGSRKLVEGRTQARALTAGPQHTVLSRGLWPFRGWTGRPMTLVFQEEVGQPGRNPCPSAGSLRAGSGCPPVRLHCPEPAKVLGGQASDGHRGHREWQWP